MSIFDKKTKSKAVELFKCISPCDTHGVCDNCIDAKLWKMGRNSVKSSLEELARALLDCQHSLTFPEEDAWRRGSLKVIESTINKVKEDGNWPL